MGLTKPRASQIFNLDYKQATRVVTVTNVALSGGAPSMVDNVSLSTNDRVLVTGQTTSSQNGLYDVVTVGTGSNGTWVRTSDANSTGEIEAGMIVMVTEGSVYADTQWKLITDNPITIGTTGLVFTQNYSANSISGGTSNVTVYSNTNVTISSAGAPNVLIISSTGTVTSGTSSTTGNVTGGNILTAGQVSAVGNLTGNYLLANIAYATGYTASRIYNGVSEVDIATANGNANISINGTSNVAVFATTGAYVTGLLSATGNVTGGNLNTAGQVSAVGNLTGNYLLANIAYATGYTASKIYNGTSEANIGTVNGNANITIGGVSNVVVLATTGVYVTGLQSVTGNITGANLITAGNIAGGNLLINNNATITGNLQVLGNVTFINSNVITTNDLVIALANNQSTYANIDGAGIYVGTAGNALTSWNYAYAANTWQTNVGISLAGNITAGNVIGPTNAFATILANGQSNIVATTSNQTLSLTTGAGSGLTWVTDPANNIITLDVASSGGSIFATGGDMGLVTEPVTASEDLGSVVDAATIFYDLGGVISAGGLVYPSQLVLPTYTAGTLPGASPPGQFVFLSTSSIGAMTAFSDGTNWRFTSSGNVVS